MRRDRDRDRGRIWDMGHESVGSERGSSRFKADSRRRGGGWGGEAKKDQKVFQGLRTGEEGDVEGSATVNSYNTKHKIEATDCVHLLLGQRVHWRTFVSVCFLFTVVLPSATTRSESHAQY